MKTIIIIGNKGVGKTSLFNYLSRQYFISTKKRDKPIINYSQNNIKIEDNFYKIIDTPSWLLFPKNIIEKNLQILINGLVMNSDLICWLVDEINENTILLGKKINNLKGKNSLLFILLNKKDVQEGEIFHKFWENDAQLLISLVKKKNLSLIGPLITNLIKSSIDNNLVVPKFNFLIIGSPNAGKSTLMNILVKSERSLITPLEGTTQEPVFAQGQMQSINFELVDTAGINKVEELDKGLWRKADLIIVLIDSTKDITKQIHKISHWGIKSYKPTIIIINKIDLVDKNIISNIEKQLSNINCHVIPSCLIEKKGLLKIVSAIKNIIWQGQIKIKPREINALVQKIISDNPKIKLNKKLKIYFVQQKQILKLSQCFIFFVNEPKLIDLTYKKFLSRRLQEELKFYFMPIQLIFKKS